jgi:kynureninase
MDFTIDHAHALDAADTLADYRNRYHIPAKDGKEYIYLTGNSLGLQPKSTSDYIQQELTDWANLGVEGHFDSKNPWYPYHHFLTQSIAKLVGAKEIEVCAMNTLSVNLNLLMISFYKPTKSKYKIIIERNAFPSDIYAVQQQVKFHGYDPEDAIIYLESDAYEYVSTEYIIQTIELHKNEVAMLMIGGVNYYTGQVFDMQAIAKKCNDSDIKVGFDLAHAAGNIVMHLHDWNVDFATWCGYKYLNSGPGGVSSIFVHEKHAHNADLPRLAGWWGNDEKTRFTIPKDFIPQPGAAGWQMSNAQILPMAAHRAALEIFDLIGMEALRAKSETLSSYLLTLLDTIPHLNIITPRAQTERGCQVSIIVMKDKGKAIFNELSKNHIIADWREPNVIRVAPTPMYNTFVDVWNFVHVLKSLMEKG